MSAGFADYYLDKFRSEVFIEPEVYEPFNLIVVIPCFNEPDILTTLLSLNKCNAYGIHTAVVVVVNSPEEASDEVTRQNSKTLEELDKFRRNENCTLKLFLIHA